MLQSMVYLCPDIGTCGDGTDGGEVIGWYGDLVDTLNSNSTNTTDIFGDLLDGVFGDTNSTGDDIWSLFDDDNSNLTSWFADDDNTTDDIFGEQFACVEELEKPVEECIAQNGCDESCGSMFADDDAVDDSIFNDDGATLDICGSVTLACDGYKQSMACCPACQSEMDAFMECYFDAFARDFCQVDSCDAVTSTSKNTESEVDKSEEVVESSAHSSKVFFSAVLAGTFALLYSF